MHENIGRSLGTDYWERAEFPWPLIQKLGRLESIHTYEGTETIQTLIVGRDITGVGAFA
jgi:hypothetical protein